MFIARMTSAPKSFLTLWVAAMLLTLPVAVVHAAADEGVQENSPAVEVDAATSDVLTSVDPPGAYSKETLNAYNRGVELFQIAQVQAEKGNLKGQKDLLRQSIKNFEQALVGAPDIVEAQSNIGFAYLTLNDYRKAKQAFESALAIDDKHLNTLNGLGNTLTLAEETQEALTVFEKLVTLDPGNPQYWFNYGSVLQKVGRFKDAEAKYEAALRLDPKDQRTLFNMGTLLDNQGKVESALDYYQQAKRLNVSNPVGLEAIRRIEYLEALQKSAKGPSPKSS